MVIDTSALVAILRGEPEQRVLLECLESASSSSISAANFVEVSIVIEVRYGAEGVRDLDRFLAVAGIELVPVDKEQAEAARAAYAQFGKGRHRAGLNFGDCFAYALAAVRGEPILCKGDDFIHTDLQLAVR